ncbi:MAG: 2-amino-4-hydroxy-6-hydroxymethyldihydropteridine diphosphokinase, partial [Muribaculaceae bacterium]|nr:2-amino-4-hydroxy-6-hydroxymethyldihydropteridine diphosphokinase [Muribaculaceae bacterium]
RELAIDIVSIYERTIEVQALTLPHPRLAERDFFLVPL